MQEETIWIEQILAGDKQVYSHIINKYKNPLFATILRMTKNPHDAQDLVQEALIKVYKQLNKYNDQGSFSSWFYRVAINHCMDEFRKKRYEQVEMNEETIGETPNYPEITFLKKEKSRQLELLLARLPEDERFILLLRYVNELSYEEISELAGVPISTIRNKLHRAKKKLKVIVSEEGSYFNEVSDCR